MCKTHEIMPPEPSRNVKERTLYSGADRGKVKYHVTLIDQKDKIETEISSTHPKAYNI